MRQELHAQRGVDTSQAYTLGTAALRMRGVRQAFWAQGPLEEARTHAPTETAPRTAPAAATVLICGLLEWSEDVIVYRYRERQQRVLTLWRTVSRPRCAGDSHTGNRGIPVTDTSGSSAVVSCDYQLTFRQRASSI